MSSKRTRPPRADVMVLPEAVVEVVGPQPHFDQTD